MPDAVQTRDWFDDIWDTKVSPTLPIYLRSAGVKQLARGAVRVLVESMGAHAKSPEGLRQVVAFARIAAILKGATGVMDAPDPTPEQVADAVERLVARVKP
jgi:hypothetical protein